MKIKNINQLKKSINRITILVSTIIFISVLLVLFLTHHNFSKTRELHNKQEIIAAGNIFKLNLSEKLSIIASSTVFLDYLNSGEISRKNLSSQFLSQISTLKSKNILGMQLLDENGTIIFSHGLISKDYISVKLCYLNQVLDSEMGDCRFSWKLFFDMKNLLNELMTLNKDINTCNKCIGYNLIDNDKFGSFFLESASNIKVNIHIKDDNDYFYIYFFLITITMVIFSMWNWYHISLILNNYISLPIHNLINCLKNNGAFDKNNGIEEIQYLINEINEWKEKINKNQADENAAKIGKIAAQLAHDVRSPLSAIDMLLKNLTSIPENYRQTLRNATQRISDIANIFLLEYKSPQDKSTEHQLSCEYIPYILDSMVSEKRGLYEDRKIKIYIDISENAWDIFSYINPLEFKRLLSNLINNSVEALEETGNVAIKLIKLEGFLRIEINDNGCGIDPQLLPKIVTGTSIGKKNGTGLGLSHAISKIEEWNGDFDIRSHPGIGTQIGITLPLASSSPLWFKPNLNISKATTICILDDEEITHEQWKRRLQDLTGFNPQVHNFYTPDELIDFIQKSEITDILYLIDHDLGTTQPTGTNIIESLNLYKNSILVTNQYDDPLIQNKCVELKINIIPKNFILNIPIFLQAYSLPASESLKIFKSLD